MIEVSVNTVGLENKIVRLAAYTHKSVGEVMRREGRLLGVQLSRYTQPFGFDDKAKESGENAIKRDVLRVFYVLPDNLTLNPTPIKSGEYAGWLKLFTTKTGTVFAVKQENFRIRDSNQTLYRHHQEMRGRDGTVPRNRGLVNEQPRFTAINAWVITQTQYQNYLPFIQKESGFSKGGWATAISKLGTSGKKHSSGGTRGIPGWVTRHKGKAPGEAIDKTSDAHPTLTLRNLINYTSQVLSNSGQQGAVRDTEYRLQKSIQSALTYGIKDA